MCICVSSSDAERVNCRRGFVFFFAQSVFESMCVNMCVLQHWFFLCMYAVSVCVCMCDTHSLKCQPAFVSAAEVKPSAALIRAGDQSAQTGG